MLILMTRIPEMLGGTSNINVRLNFLASCVRRITSLTCALVSMKPRTRDQSGGDQDPPEGSCRGCINMVCAAKVVTHAKDYGSSQPNLGKDTSGK